MFSSKRIYNDFITPEEYGKKIGIFRAMCAIFGGLIISYLGMIVVTFLIPSIPNESIIFALLFNTFAWAGASLWISLSASKLIALIRVIIPTLVFSISIYLYIQS